MDAPHYVRFARALALAGGLAGATSSCAMTTTHESDAGTDADRDAYIDCTTCACDEFVADSGLPFCTGVRIFLCGCAAVGPLPPPDLACV